jgi:hypothetical protein
MVTEMPKPKRVTYRLELVTYLDILGFKAQIEQRTAGEISRILRRFKENARPDPETEKTYGATYRNFSDLSVRAVPLYTEANLTYRIGPLYSELLSLVHIQCALLDEGILIRGGLTLGQVVKSWGLLYGPGLVRAYQLEQKAVHPRILIDKVVFEELRARDSVIRRHDVKTERKFISRMVRVQGAVTFVDYLRGIQDEFDEPEYYLQFLAKHRDLVEKGLHDSRRQKKVLAKYRWLRSYHNTTIQGLHLRPEIRRPLMLVSRP